MPEDQLGNAYEYLIKEFADDSGHNTAAEFYTDRTVVKLMTLIILKKAVEPCGSRSCFDKALLSDGRAQHERLPHTYPFGEHSKIPFAMSLSKGDRDFGKLNCGF